MKRTALLAAFILVLTGCGGGGNSGETTVKTATTPATTLETTGGQAATNYSVALNPLNGSNTSGTATFTEGSGGVEVALAVQGLPIPGTSYLAHIHPGTCADALADEGAEGEEGTTSDQGGASTTGEEEMEYPLQPVVSDSSGNGTSTTVLPSITLGDLFSVSAPKYVNVHGAGAGEPPPIACGDLNRGGAE